MKTKVILSTNIAESSVTIPDVTHIINTGLEKQIAMPNAGTVHMEILTRSWCSKASVKQRSGRAGRIRPGTAYHLFTKAFMNTCMPAYSTPELLRKPLVKVVLQLKAQMGHLGTPTELLHQAMSPPDTASIGGAFKVLHQLTAVTLPTESTDNEITALGLFCCHFPLDVRLCRLFLYGLSAYDMGLLSHGVVDVVILVCLLASPDLFIAPSYFHVKSPAQYMSEMKQTLGVIRASIFNSVFLD